MTNDYYEIHVWNGEFWAFLDAKETLEEAEKPKLIGNRGYYTDAMWFYTSQRRRTYWPVRIEIDTHSPACVFDVAA